MPSKYRHRLSGLCLLFILLMMQACSGYHLRGEDSLGLKPLRGQLVYIEPENLEEGFLKTLRKALINSGAQLADSMNGSAISVRITGFDSDKTVSAYSSVREVREFNHYLEVDFSASRKPAGQAKPRQVSAKVRAERAQIYDSRYVLGVSAEERDIQKELQREVARLLALRLVVLRTDVSQ